MTTDQEDLGDFLLERREVVCCVVVVVMVVMVLVRLSKSFSHRLQSCGWKLFPKGGDGAAGAAIARRRGGLEWWCT